jgi:hypothetical protein
MNTKFCSESMTVKDILGDLDIDRSVILKLIVENQGVDDLTAFTHSK